MATEAQFVLLGVHARQARELWHRHPPAAREALGEAIKLANQMLKRWLAAYPDEHVGSPMPEAEDLLSEAAVRLIARFSQLEILTGKEFAARYKKIVENLVRDLERRYRSRREATEGDRSRDRSNLGQVQGQVQFVMKTPANRSGLAGGRPVF